MCYILCQKRFHYVHNLVIWPLGNVPDDLLGGSFPGTEGRLHGREPGSGTAPSHLLSTFTSAFCACWAMSVGTRHPRWGLGHQLLSSLVCLTFPQFLQVSFLATCFSAHWHPGWGQILPPAPTPRCCTFNPDFLGRGDPRPSVTFTPGGTSKDLGTAGGQERRQPPHILG